MNGLRSDELMRRIEELDDAVREMLDFAARWDGYGLDDNARLERIYAIGMTAIGAGATERTKE